MSKISEHVEANTTGEAVLSPFEQRFIDEYLKDLNCTRAWMRSGGGGKREYAAQRAYETMQRPRVARALDAALKARAADVKIEAEMVLREIVAIATANPNEIVEVRRGCCRYCYGTEHRYQYADEEELSRARAKFETEDISLVEVFTHGGVGFDPRLAPLGDCPRCGGEGGAYVHVNDTRDLSPAALALYAGAKQTKDGIEVKLHDKSKHIEMLARHLGMFNDKLEVTGNLAERILAARKRARG